MKTKITANFQQAYFSSCCGAYSLTAILDALGFFDIQFDGKSLTPSGSIPVHVSNKGFSVEDVRESFQKNSDLSLTEFIERAMKRKMEQLNRTTEISKDAFLKGFANQVYTVTGSPQFGCTNFPSAVLIAAKQLGIKNIKLHVVRRETRKDICDSMGDGLLKKFWLKLLNLLSFNKLEDYLETICNGALFAVELEMCRRAIGEENVVVVNGFEDYEEPKDNECQEALVMIKSEYEKGALHWIAKDAHGKYYDPIKGTSDNHWDGLVSKKPQVIEDVADIVRRNTIDCDTPNIKAKIKYEWIGLWITYSM